MARNRCRSPCAFGHAAAPSAGSIHCTPIALACAPVAGLSVPSPLRCALRTCGILFMLRHPPPRVRSGCRLTRVVTIAETVSATAEYRCSTGKAKTSLAGAPSSSEGVREARDDPLRSIAGVRPDGPCDPGPAVIPGAGARSPLRSSREPHPPIRAPVPSSRLARWRRRPGGSASPCRAR